jgi:hypothetical protein
MLTLRFYVWFEDVKGELVCVCAGDDDGDGIVLSHVTISYYQRANAPLTRTEGAAFRNEDAQD